EEIAYQLRDSGAKVLLTLTSYHDRIEQLCTNTNVKHVISTDVREYLPVRQRVLLTNLIDDLGAFSEGFGATPNRTMIRDEESSIPHHGRPQKPLHRSPPLPPL